MLFLLVTGTCHAFVPAGGWVGGSRRTVELPPRVRSRVPRPLASRDGLAGAAGGRRRRCSVAVMGEILDIQQPAAAGISLAVLAYIVRFQLDMCTDFGKLLVSCVAGIHFLLRSRLRGIWPCSKRRITSTGQYITVRGQSVPQDTVYTTPSMIGCST